MPKAYYKLSILDFTWYFYLNTFNKYTFHLFETSTNVELLINYLKRRKSPQSFKNNWFFIINDQNNTMIIDQIDGLIRSIEEEKNDSQVRESTEAGDESWWIDIKKDTDKLENEQITKLLRRDLFGDDGE